MKKFYFVNGGEKDNNDYLIEKNASFLVSYFPYIKKPQNFRNDFKNCKDIFLDSGAFTAHQQNKQVDIDQYIEFIKSNSDIISHYANLDDIENANNTWKNQKYIESNGLTPVPCIHYGEDFKWIKRYLKYGYEYLALGGVAKSNTKARISWLDYIFQNYLVDSKGFPLIKLHGFGISSLDLMIRYPWHSVDSLRWTILGGLGLVFVPTWNKNKWKYGPKNFVYNISIKGSPQIKHNYFNCSKVEKKLFEKYIEGKGFVIGKSERKWVDNSYELQENEFLLEKQETRKLIDIRIETGLCNCHKERIKLNGVFFLEIEKHYKKQPNIFTKKNNTLF